MKPREGLFVLSRCKLTRGARVMSISLAFVAATTIVATGQQQPRDPGREPITEAASIHMCDDDPHGRGVGPTAGSHTGLLRLNCQTLIELVERAYDELSGRVTGGDGWMRSERYDIVGRAHTAMPLRQMTTAMLREILEERFALRIHREARSTRVYALSVTKGGASRLRAAAAEDCVEPQAPVPLRLLENGRAAVGAGGKLPCGLTLSATSATGASVFEASAARIEAIAKFIERQLDRPVVDRTMLEGRLNAHFEYAPLRSGPVDSPAPSLFFALKENLGLELTPTLDRISFVVIDAAVRPNND